MSSIIEATGPTHPLPDSFASKLEIGKTKRATTRALGVAFLSSSIPDRGLLTSDDVESSYSPAIPPPAPFTLTPQHDPVLLLEGDVLRVIDGVARTRYRMETTTNASRKLASPVAIEESHELATGRKLYALKREIFACVSHDVIIADSDSSAADLALLDIQEFTSVCSREATASRVDSTGGSTWESSVAMALHFASSPNDLRGRVLELGSGVGVGGSLLLTLHNHHPASSLQSLTLTDGNRDVVRQCQENVFRATSHIADMVPIDVRHLNWNDDAQLSRLADVKFDTILASDCVYSHDDVTTLVNVLTGLLKEEHGPHSSPEAALTPSRIHIFSPLNRSALPEFVVALKAAGMETNQEIIKVQRSRLGTHGEEYSSNLSRFVHVTASHGQPSPTASLNDVD
jgi:predicted nicotinamide N-methyase